MFDIACPVKSTSMAPAIGIPVEEGITM